MTIWNEFSSWFEAGLRWIPGRCGYLIRYYYFRSRLNTCGHHLRIAEGCILNKCANISLGDNVWFGRSNQIYAQGNVGDSIEIGDNCAFNSNVMINADCGGSIKFGRYISVGPNVVFRASGHHFNDRDIPFQKQGHDAGGIVVEDDVWIGANVVILPNVSIGRGAVVGAGAVVTKDVESFAIVGGIPARCIGTRGEDA